MEPVDNLWKTPELSTGKNAMKGATLSCKDSAETKCIFFLTRHQ